VIHILHARMIQNMRSSLFVSFPCPSSFEKYTDVYLEYKVLLAEFLCDSGGVGMSRKVNSAYPDRYGDREHI
jgi:hypothetical protein